MISKLIKKIMYPHNYSSDALIEYLRSLGATVGEDVYFYSPIKTIVDTANARFIEIGNNVQITSDVKILAHDYSFFVLANAYNSLARKQRKTVIGNNVFIGVGATILMGSDIGDNVIIGAGAVVSGKVESNSVYAGNPAVKICTLEKHFNSNKKHFIDSAKCYAEGFKKKNGRLPHPEEMIAYRALFCDRKTLSEYAQKEHFRGITAEAKKNMSMPEFENMFSSVEELMNYKG
ncbi:MAG: acyltransferase [Ruminococcus sp.]|nr:acyltransferase [Ruminococcus sp.]